MSKQDPKKEDRSTRSPSRRTKEQSADRITANNIGNRNAVAIGRGAIATIINLIFPPELFQEFIRQIPGEELIRKVAMAEVISSVLMLSSIWISRGYVPATATLDQVILYALLFSLVPTLFIWILGSLKKNYTLLFIAIFPGNILLLGMWIMSY